MNIIKTDLFFANQFWIATRFFESIVILTGFYFLGKKKKINPDIVFVLFLFVSVFIILSILYWQFFPVCYIKGEGQTLFKIISEYVIIGILITALLFLRIHKQKFDIYVYRLLFFSILFAIITEFSFTLYVSNFGLTNQIGHYSKLITFYFIYKANVETGFVKPTETIFKNLYESEKKYKNLYEEYHSQSEDLKQKNKELNELNITKDKFFSILAHDLKNPFNAILGLSELMQNNATRYPPEKTQRLSTHIHTSSKQVYSLLENLLDWSRIQTGRIKPSPQEINIELFMQTINDLLSPMAMAKNIDLQIINKTDKHIFADAQMLNTVLRNLITNALKFTYNGGKVSVTIKQQNDDYVLFIISDTGIGIACEHIEKLFKIDSKLSKTGTNNETGTGLGLILCKDFVEMNNGKIWVESEINKGSHFNFTVPVINKKNS